MTDGPVLVTTDQAADLLDVPATLISQWKTRERITPVGLLRGRGRGGQVPLYRLDVLKQLADDYHRRRATRQHPAQ